MLETAQRVAIVAVVAVVVMFTNLGGPRLWDRDEPRNAQCAAEMLARGDWVTPVMNSELRTHKPVLHYWLMMSAYSVFGITEFAARFWSATLAVGTALCTFILGRKLFDERVGMWAGIAISTTLMFDVSARAATTDSPLIFFSTLAITIYVLGTRMPASEASSGVRDTRVLFPKWSWAVAMYSALGIAMLAKGPVGLVLPVAVIGMTLLVLRLPAMSGELSGRRWWRVARRAASCFAPMRFLSTCWMMRPVTALTVSLAIALPWYVWVGIRTDGEFLRGFFLDHNLSRATQSMEGHDGSILYYPVAILVGFFPWSVFAVPVALDAMRNSRVNASWRRGYVLAGCWVGVYVALFSIAQTKLPSYVTPCYPALALLTGCFISRWIQASLAVSQSWFRAALGITAMVGLGFVIGVPLVAARFLPGEGWLGSIGMILIAGSIVALICNERSQPAKSAGVFAGTAVIFTTVLFGVVADRVDSHQQIDHILGAISKRDARTRIASYGLLEPSWVFYSGQSIDELSVSADQSPSPAWLERHGKWIRKPVLCVEDILKRTEPYLIITSDEYLPRLERELVGGFDVIAKAEYFLHEESLYLVAPHNPQPPTATDDTSADSSKRDLPLALMSIAATH